MCELIVRREEYRIVEQRAARSASGNRTAAQAGKRASTASSVDSCFVQGRFQTMYVIRVQTDRRSRRNRSRKPRPLSRRIG
jgi:hypothetical protein